MNDNTVEIYQQRQLAALKATFARLDAVALAIAGGVVGGIVLLAATLALLAAGAPMDAPVGGHLGLLSHFLPGYDVSMQGAVVGFGYGVVIGGLVGIFVASIWNIAHHIYALSIATRSIFERSMD